MIPALLLADERGFFSSNALFICTRHRPSKNEGSSTRLERKVQIKQGCKKRIEEIYTKQSGMFLYDCINTKHLFYGICTRFISDNVALASIMEFKLTKKQLIIVI